LNKNIGSSNQNKECFGKNIGCLSKNVASSNQNIDYSNKNIRYLQKNIDHFYKKHSNYRGFANIAHYKANQKQKLIDLIKENHNILLIR